MNLDLVPLGWMHFAASVERASEHPLAAAVMDAASAGNIALSPIRDFKASSGKGASAVIDNRRVILGTAKFLGEADIATDALQPQAERLRADGALLQPSKLSKRKKSRS